MFKNSYKFLFFLSMTIGTFIAISSFSWFSIWMGLEINLLSFIPLMKSTKNLYSSESSLKYFLIQALASAIFLFAIILFFILLNFKQMNLNLILISMTMMLKNGAAPMHFWLPSVMEGLSWNSNLILMTWQKIAPLTVLTYSMNLNLLIFIIFFCMIFGSLGGLNQTSMRKLLAFSSINHLGWMIAGMMNSEKIWLLYFLFYSFLNITIVFLLNNQKLFNINQMFSLNNSNFMMKTFLFLSILSLGGLPPFLGFFAKWMIIENMIFNKQLLILLFMLFLTLMTLYFYLRMSYSAFLLNHNNVNWHFKNYFSNFNSKTIFFLSFFSTFGLMFMNLFYYFI